MACPTSERERHLVGELIVLTVFIILLLTTLGLSIWRDFHSPTPKVRIVNFSLSPNLTAAAAANSNRSSVAAPLTANCNLSLAFDNDQFSGGDYNKVDQYDEIKVLVVWAGRNKTFMRAHPGSFWQKYYEQKSVVLAANDSVVLPDLKSAVVYTFTVEVKSRVKEDPMTMDEETFYIKATCDNVRVGFGSTEGVDRIATMLDGPQKCKVVKSKSSFNL